MNAARFAIGQITRRSRRKIAGGGGRWVAVIATAALLAGSGSAWGQVQRIPGGDLLDANPQIGSGGSNRPVPGYQPINGNAIIHGNVSGLGYFHGNIPYSSPYTFQGSLGSAGLQDFARQSAGAPVGSAGIGQMQTYYLPSGLVSTYSGRINPSAAFSPVSNGFDARITGRLALSPSADHTFAPTPTEVSAGAIPMHPISEFSTQPLAPTYQAPQTSALFGLRLTDSSGLDALAPGQLPGGRPGTRGPGQQPVTPGQTPGLKPGQTSEEDALVNDRRVGAPLDLERRAVSAVPLPMDQRLDPAVGNVLAPSREGLAGTAQAGLGGDTGSSAYGSLLDRLYASQQRLTDSNRGPAQLTPGQPAQAAPTLGQPTLPPGQMRPTVPGQEASPTMKFGPGGQPPRPGHKPPTTLSPDTVEGRAALQAGRELQPLQTLVGRQGTPFNELMAQAENELQAGDFMKAAESYQEALRLQPQDGLALVGRANAELAAGMYESAAFDLKYLFQHRPEMISVPYDFKRFMPPQRLTYLLNDLSRLAKQPDNEPAPLLLAYLQYQLGEPQQAQQTLRAWQQKSPKNQWPALLEKAWVEPVRPAAAEPATRK